LENGNGHSDGRPEARERLVESELIAKYNVKRFTIRKVIQELAHLGFVELTPNKGARVADITDEELEDLYCVRVSLELLAAELLIKKITPEKLSVLWKIHKEYTTAVDNGDIEGMVLKNEEFHQTLYLMTENRFLADNLDRLKNGIFALRYNAYLSLGIPQLSVCPARIYHQCPREWGFREAEAQCKREYHLSKDDPRIKKTKSSNAIAKA